MNKGSNKKKSAGKAMRNPLKSPTGLTRKQEAFVREIVNNPKISATQAAVETYGKPGQTISRGTAEQIAFDNLRNPRIVSELSKYNNLVENTLINTIQEYSISDKLGERTLAVDTAKYVHDKINGKATQRLETASTSVQISINLTSQGAE